MTPVSKCGSRPVEHLSQRNNVQGIVNYRGEVVAPDGAGRSSGSDPVGAERQRRRRRQQDGPGHPGHQHDGVVGVGCLSSLSDRCSEYIPHSFNAVKLGEIHAGIPMNQHPLASCAGRRRGGGGGLRCQNKCGCGDCCSHHQMILFHDEVLP